MTEVVATVSNMHSIALNRDTTDTLAAWDINAPQRLIELSTGDDPAYRSLSNYVLNYLNLHAVAGASVLDVGCGLGFLSRELADAGYDVTAIDPSDASIAIAREQNRGASRLRFSASDLQTFATENPAQKYDLLVANMTLHAVEHLGSFMRAASKLLAPSGFLLATVPNPYTYIQTRDDIDVSAVDLTVDQTLTIPFRIRNHRPHQSDVVFFHRTVRSYSIAAENAGMKIADYATPEHIGPGRPRDITAICFSRHMGPASLA